MTRFWQNWLTLWCIAVAAFGIVLYGAAFAATSGPAAAVFRLFANPLPADPDRYLRFAIGLMGAVTAGWALSFYAACRGAWALTGALRATVWRLLTIAILAWYVIDSTASVALGFGLNAVSNTVLLALYLVPVLATRALATGGD